MNLYEQFSKKARSAQFGLLRESFKDKLQLIHEANDGRGAGILTSGGTVKDGFAKAIKSISYDYLNMSHEIGRKEAKFNFRNYYALDLRLKLDKLLPEWEKGRPTYTKIMDGVYENLGLEGFMKDKLRNMYLTWRKSVDAEDGEHGTDLTSVRKSLKGAAGKVLYNSVDIGSFKRYMLLKEEGDYVGSSPGTGEGEYVDSIGQEPEEDFSGEQSVGDEEISKEDQLTLDDDRFWKNSLYIILQNDVVREFYNTLPTVSENNEPTLEKPEEEDEPQDIVPETPPEVAPEDTPESLQQEPNRMGESVGQTPETPQTLEETQQDQESALQNNSTLIIKHRDTEGGKSEFVDMIVSGLVSANRGNEPQGLTITDILTGKFGRKPISPGTGTFINRVKDESSDQSLDYRSWKQENLEGLHDVIMNTFKRDQSLKQERIKEISVDAFGTGSPTRESIFLYITQEDYNKLADGGQGWSKLAKGALAMTQGGQIEL